MGLFIMCSIDRARMMRLFHAIDIDKSESLDKAEMVGCVANTREARSDHNLTLLLTQVFKDMDVDHNGKVSADEFCQFFEAKGAKNGEKWLKNYFEALEDVVGDP